MRNVTLADILEELKKLGSEQTKKVFTRHGAKEPFFGVKVADLKIIQKKIKKNHELAVELFDTGNSDAMYLAGLIAKPDKMTKKQLQNWANKANWYMISEYTVAWITAESNYGWELALEWIDSKDERIASAGWSTLSSIVMITQDDELDIKILKSLLKRVQKEIPTAPNRVRYTMNGFVIALGSAVTALTKGAIETAVKIGKVNVEMGGTACKVPDAKDYINKVIAKGNAGKKKKTAVC